MLPKAVALKAALVPGQGAAHAAVRRMPAAMAKHPGQAITAAAATQAGSSSSRQGSRCAPAAGRAAAAAANKKPVSQRHGFKTNEYIVYPAHGVGRIVSIEEQEIAGMTLELFVINFEKDKMTLRVPTGKSQSVGMRKLAEEDVVKKALGTLKGKARVKRTMWSRRAQEYEAKINSGDLVSIAEVVRDLYRSEASPSSPIPSGSSTRPRSTAWRARSPPSRSSTSAAPCSASPRCCPRAPRAAAPPPRRPRSRPPEARERADTRRGP